MNKQKIIDRLEKDTRRTYAIKTSLFENGENKPISETVRRSPFVTITVETADKILELLKDQTEIVHCVDCVHFKEGVCELYGFRREDGYFCADGEAEGRRRDAE